MTKRQRREFDSRFKLDVVRMVRDQGLPVSAVCRTMDLVDSVVRRWLRQADAEQAGERGSGVPLNADQRQIRALERENASLRADVDFLKRASAFFARELK